MGLVMLGVSRAQGALALLLQQLLPGLDDAPEAFDPVFTEDDKSILHHLGIQASRISRSHAQA